MAQSVERPISAQVVILQFVSSSPASGSVLTARSLEPASIMCFPLSAPPPLVLCLCVSKVNKCKKKKKVQLNTFEILIGFIKEFMNQTACTQQVEESSEKLHKMVFIGRWVG